jgi:ATP-dependent helicase/nuclease subunit B
MQLQMYKQLFQNLTPNDVIITVNRRLTTYLYESYSNWQLQGKNNHWVTPTILPWASWLEQLWQNSQATARDTPLKLLTAQQERIIWEQIIVNSTYGTNLFHIAASAQLAREAWTLHQQWQINIDTQKFAPTEELLAWQAWAKEFKNYCTANNWLDTACLSDYIAHAIEKNLCAYPKRIFLLGFNELTPQTQHLLNILEKQGCAYQLIEQQQSALAINKIAFHDTQVEIQTMARWCQQQLLTDTNSTIACVVPDLLTSHRQIINTFNECALPFNISSSLLLHEYPLIHTAFNLLSLTEETTVDAISVLLRSPFLAGAEQELSARAELDAVLRKQNEFEINCQQIIALAKQYHCPLFSNQLQAFILLQKKQEKLLRPSQWAQLFSQQLLLLGWPGERTLSSTEYQLYERWQELLAELTSLDTVLNRIDVDTVRYQLVKLAHTPFQPQSVNTRIQLLGVLEAAGLHFQHLWIMGMHDDSWPPPAQANPFIPYALQRQLKLPHASNERELQFCKALTQQLICSAEQIIFSFPQYEEDRPLRASRLIASLPTITITDLNLSADPTNILNTTKFEYFMDYVAPAISEQEKINGGSVIMKYQAACPFHAFARFRLGAESLAKINLGLNAIERGNLLHRVLEILWNKLSDQATLLKLSAEELQEIVRQAIDAAFIPAIKKNPLTFKKYFTDLEKKRLTILLHNWLAQEKQRPAFKVLAIEQAQDFTIGQIPLKLRIDRIDELADGTRIIIDYKTGNVSINSWLGERPDEPQLPIYCIANTTQISGLLFAQIKNNKANFQGITAQDLQIKGVKTFPGWQTLLAQWQCELEKLAKEFYQGHAEVHPKYAEQTCQYCDLQLLCRVKEKEPTA